eukprot:GEMP01027368.1.p1 GENE.GEMP01027368.1~~GEMP01027368.1.p1  ORF type:complete len:356 (+),score=85.49 GEMP01027368.1:361-1428(+)
MTTIMTASPRRPDHLVDDDAAAAVEPSAKPVTADWTSYQSRRTKSRILLKHRTLEGTTLPASSSHTSPRSATAQQKSSFSDAEGIGAIGLPTIVPAPVEVTSPIIAPRGEIVQQPNVRPSVWLANIATLALEERERWHSEMHVARGTSNAGEPLDSRRLGPDSARSSMSLPPPTRTSDGSVSDAVERRRTREVVPPVVSLISHFAGCSNDSSFATRTGGGAPPTGLAKQLAQSIVAMSESRQDVVKKELGLNCAQWISFYIRLEFDNSRWRWLYVNSVFVLTEEGYEVKDRQWVLGLGRLGVGGGVIPEKLVNRLLLFGYYFEQGFSLSKCIRDEEDIIMVIDVPRCIRIQYPQI